MARKPGVRRIGAGWNERSSSTLRAPARQRAHAFALVAFLAAAGADGCAPRPGANVAPERAVGRGRPEAREPAVRGSSGGLSTGEQIDIARSLALTVSRDATESLDGACGLPVSTRMSFPDLNGDGSPEVVVDYGNACTSGMAGTSVALFVKDPGGHYRLASASRG